MPDNEVEDRLQNLFELENISQCQIPSQSVGGNSPVLSHSHWVGRLGQFAAPLDFNPHYFSERQLDSVEVHCDQSFVELTPRVQNFRSNSRNQQLNTDELLLKCQNFQTKQNQPTIEGKITGHDHYSLSSIGSSVFQSQQTTECVDSPTLTTNSGRSEITEVSTDFNFLRGQLQPERGHYPGSLQSRIMQQSTYNDMQLLQQHVMFKQLQELQQQRQLQQLGDMKQQNSLNQLSAFAKQTAGGQFPPLINGTPVHDTSQVFRNWVQRGASPAGQGIPNRVMLEQGQALHSMGVVPQLQDMSLFGTPIANARGNLSQYSHLQELSNDSVNMMASASGQLQKPVMQSSSFNNPSLGDRRAVSGEQVGMSQGAFVSKQGSQGRNIYGQVPVHGLNTGGFSGSPQEGNTLQTSASLKEFSGKHEQVGWPSMQQTTKQLGPSQGFVPLDPMEEKILYNMDDNIWDASFGRRPDMDTGSSGNLLEHTDPSNMFPSIQSGSWSALMQSAVAESSSSDTGLQEEWSGITFQNTEQSNDNLLPNFMDSEKQQIGWVDSNLQNTSFNSKPFPMFNDGNINSSFPGFQQAAVQFSVEGREAVRQDGSHEAIEYCNPQQKSSIEENQRVQSFMHLDNALAGQMYMHSESNAQNQRIASQNNVGQPFAGNGAMNQGAFPDGFLWKGDGNSGASSFSRSIGDIEQVQSGAAHSPPIIENLQTPNFSAAMNSSIFKAHLPTNQYVPDSYQTDYKEQITLSANSKGNERGEKIQQVANSPLGTHNYYGGANATYEKQQNCCQNENSNDCYTSKELIGHGQGHFGQFKSLSHVSSSSDLDKGCLPDFQKNSKAQEVAPSRSDHMSNFHSQNMLELLHKVDQSREDGSLGNFGSSDYISSSQGPRAETPNASSSQLYTQSSSSQGFGLRLASPSQGSLNSNLILPSQSSWKAAGNLNSEQASTEFGLKSPTWLSPQSTVQSLPMSRKLRQEAYYDNQFGSPGHTSNSSILNLQGGSNTSVTSSPYFKNQLQMHFMSNIAAAPQSLQGILPSAANRYPQFNHATSKDTSQQMIPNPLSQQSPVLGNVPVHQPSIVSGMSQQGEISAGPDSLWKNVLPQQQPLDGKSLEVPSNLPSSSDLSNNDVLMTSAPEGPTVQISEKGENYAASSVKTQGFRHEDEQAAIERSLQLQQTSIDIPEGSQISGSSPGPEPVEKLMLGAAGLASGSLVGYSRLHEPDRIRNNDNPPNLVQPNDSKMLNFLRGARESLSVKALQQPAVRDTYCPQTAGFGQNVSQDQSGSSNAVSNNTDRGQIDLRMAPSWFKQYGTLRNGQMVPMYDARVGKTAVGQLSLGKSSQNMHGHPLMECLDGADASHGGRVWPRTTATLVPDKHLSAPYVLPSDATTQSVAVMRQKRKIATIEPLPWHKEVIEGFKGFQTICMTEREWAQATNRLIEKVQYEVEIMEDAQQSLRSKRRLIMTTQLMHHLFRPAPATLILADAASHYESVSYFVSKLSVGDACSLANCARNSLLVPVDDDNMEKLKDTKKCSDQQFSEVVEALIGRTNKLENEFQRLEKSASIVGLRVECQDLERFAVINRFAKFHSHSRAQVDSSGASFPSGAPRSFPQRYVAALPMPRNIPEGVQCLSL